MGLTRSAVGKAIADGVKKGIEDGAQAIVDAAVKAANAALKAAKDALGIKSPSKIICPRDSKANNIIFQKTIKMNADYMSNT